MKADFVSRERLKGAIAMVFLFDCLPLTPSRGPWGVDHFSLNENFVPLLRAVMLAFYQQAPLILIPPVPDPRLSFDHDTEHNQYLQETFFLSQYPLLNLLHPHSFLHILPLPPLLLCSHIVHLCYFTQRQSLFHPHLCTSLWVLFLAQPNGIDFL